MLFFLKVDIQAENVLRHHRGLAWGHVPLYASGFFVASVFRVFPDKIAAPSCGILYYHLDSGRRSSCGDRARLTPHLAATAYMPFRLACVVVHMYLKVMMFFS